MLRNADRAIEIAVTDTGIGIPEDKQKLIFEAFQQADGTTSRKYGGTGLGLSISREIARLLGGELQVRSKPGEGSTFTLYVPLEAAPSVAPAVAGTPARYDNSGAVVPTALPTGFEVNDDRDELGKDPFVLIVEDDPTFASILLDAAHEAGLKGVVSTAGAGTLAMARKLQPSAITLDLGLADIDGFVLLDLLKHDPETSAHPDPRHLRRRRSRRSDEHGRVRSDREAGRARASWSSCSSDLRAKPPSRSRASAARRRTSARPRPTVPELAGAKVLIVDDDIRNIFSLTSVLESHDVEVLHAERGKDGILILEQTPGVDVALIDIMMPEMDGYETMQQIRKRAELADLPLIAVTAKAMKGDRQKCLDAGASDYIAKPVDIELLLALLRVWVARAREARRRRRCRSRWRRPSKPMNRPVGEIPIAAAALRRSSSRIGRPSAPRVLLVDDDERNLLAVATVLEDLGDVVLARSGEEALRHLLKGEFAVILLDVYMPGMDGYETAQIIRSREQTKGIPIVFLSAVNKEAEHLLRGYSMGAVDYVFKPVDPIVLRSKVAVFVDLFDKIEGDRAQGPARAGAARREPPRQCRAAAGRAGAAPRRAAPGGDHPVAADRALPRSAGRGAPRRRNYVSGNFEAMTGFTLASMSRASPTSVVGPAPPRRPRPRCCGASSSDCRPGRCRSNIAGDAPTATTSISSTRRCCSATATGGRSNLPGPCTDITDAASLESQLVQAQKMDAIGKLTGGIAHDFNNLLAAVIGGLGLIEKRAELAEEQQRILGMTKRAAEQGSELVRRLLAFARRQQLEPRPIDLAALRDAVLDLLTHTLGGLVKLEWRIADEDSGASSPTRRSSSSR